MSAETQANDSRKSIGKGMVRKEGRAKVTGTARYTADFTEQDLAHGVIFQSTIAAGKVDKFDLSLAAKVPGVIEIVTADNAPKLRKYSPSFPGALGDPHLPLQDKEVYYYGQPIGVVIAHTIEAAQEAARLVKVIYVPTKARIDFDELRKTSAKIQAKDGSGRPALAKKGDIKTALKNSPVTLRQTYTLPIENHHPMEPSSTLADFQGDHLKVYEATQGVANAAETLAGVFNLKKENVQVITKFVGGGFGCKGSLWTHVFIAALSSQVVKQPVKVVVLRSQMGTNVGHRARTIQDVTLGSDSKGKLLAVQHETVNPTGIYKEYAEPAGSLFKMLYQSPAISCVQKLVTMNSPGPTFMRAPGEASGSFALESAMDELAHQVNVDPVEIRLINHADRDPLKDIPFSSKSLKECYEQGAKQFGWSRRKAQPGLVRDGDYYVGYGMATSSYPVHFFASSAKIEFSQDGIAKVTSATQDIGTGTYTVMTQIAADYLGLEYSHVNFDLGDSKYPKAGVSGGSSTVSSVGWAIADASKNLLDQLKKQAMADKASPLFGAKIEDISSAQARLFLTANPSKSDSYVAILKRNKIGTLVAEGKLDEKMQKENEAKYSQHAFGAQFAEVRVHALTGEVRLVKMVGAFAAGKIVNPKTARSQFMGGMIFGIGMGLTEQNVADERYGKFMSNDLGDYHVPVNRDVPDLQIIVVDEVDTVVNPAGTKGIGEIGTVGTAAAIANAVFNATGVRVRDIPITPDKLAAELAKRA